MTRVRKCCVPGCDDIVSTRHRFPVYEEDVYNEWISRISNEKLKLLHPLDVYRSPYVVCGRHFAPVCKIEGSKKLKLYSLPTLHLPRYDDQSNTASDFLFPTVHRATDAGSSSGICEVSQNALSSESVKTVQHISTDEKAVSIACESPQTTENNLSTKLLQDSGVQPGSPNEMYVELGVQPLSSTPTKLLPNLEMNHTDDQQSMTGVRNEGSSLLKSVKVKRCTQLTPKASLLYQTAAKLKRQTRKLTKSNLSFRKRLKMAQHFSNQECFQHISEHVDSVTLKFIMSQVNLQKLKARGRRFTLDDKVLALSLYKQSGKGYRLLSKIFALPSRKTLMKLLSTIPFSPGLNQRIMDNLQKTVSKMNDLDKHCCVLFDEMALEPGIHFNEKSDKIVGFEDFGNGDRRSKLADHVLVFMVRGIRRKWKQPVAFMFCENTTKSSNLAVLIKNVIRSVRATGLNVVATVCDQGSTNQAAINCLLEDSRRECLQKGIECRNIGFNLDGEEVIPLYDVPHLLKCVRNHLLTKDVQFTWKSGVQTASWKHVVQFYKLDHGDEDTRMCPKLTDEHIFPDKIKKMKVSICAQVFSQRVSCLMRRFAEDGKYSPELDASAMETADFLLFMDKLFDSLNGGSLHARNGKYLRCAVTATSLHEEFWFEAVRVLRSLKFIDGKGNVSVPPTIRNWISTLEGMRYLWEKLSKGGFKFLCPRNFNQDPIENFFCCVRSQGVRNNNPTCSSFVTSFKSLLLNNFLSPHSVGANCEEDITEGALDTLRSLLIDGVCEKVENLSTYFPEMGCTMKRDSNTTAATNCPKRIDICGAIHAYICGYMVKKFWKLTKNCKTCCDLLSSTEEAPEHMIITARAYSPKSLCYPNTRFTRTFRQVSSVVFQYLPVVGHCSGLSKLLTSKVLESVGMEYMLCDQHNLRDMFLKLCIRVMVHTWCKNVNRILAGKMEHRGTKREACMMDSVKTQAHNKYMKRRRKK